MCIQLLKALWIYEMWKYFYLRLLRLFHNRKTVTNQAILYTFEIIRGKILYNNTHYFKYILVLLVNCQKGFKYKSSCNDYINSNYFYVGNIYCVTQNLWSNPVYVRHVCLITFGRNDHHVTLPFSSSTTPGQGNPGEKTYNTKSSKL